MKDEDKDSLETVEDREDVSHEDCLTVDIEQPKEPSQTKQNDKNKRSFQPRPAKTNDTNGLK